MTHTAPAAAVAAAAGYGVTLRIGNLVNPLSTVAAFVPTHGLPGAPPVLVGVHARLRAIAPPGDGPVTRPHLDLPA